MSGPAATALAEAVAAFELAQSGRGIRAVALEVVERDRRPVVAGTVLTQRQALEVRALARDHGAGAELVVAADPRSGMEQGWVRPREELLDTWREPAAGGTEMGRQTQYLASDGLLRSFGESAGFELVQGADLAMGWAAVDQVEAVAPPPGSHPWDTVTRAQVKLSRPPAGPGGGIESLLVAARRELGVSYVWGGTTHAGFDCSGLLQRVFRVSTGVLLPRHTGDQRRVGERVLEGGVRAGDLLFARPLAQRVGHVLLMTSAGSVLHACRTEGRVIEEGLAENRLRYQHQGWRRPVWFGEVPA